MGELGVGAGRPSRRPQCPGGHPLKVSKRTHGDGYLFECKQCHWAAFTSGPPVVVAEEAVEGIDVPALAKRLREMVMAAEEEASDG